MDIPFSAYLQKHGRIASLDRFRGLSLWLMLSFGAAKMVTFCDFFVQFSTHDIEQSWQLISGYGFYDCIAPLFVFASGAAFWAAFGSRERKFGTSQAILLSTKRSIQLIGLGGFLAFDFADPLGFVLMGGLVVVAALWIITLAKPQHKEVLRRWIGRILFVSGVLLMIANYLEMGLYLGGMEVWHEHWSAIASIGLGLLLTLSVVRLSKYGRIAACFLATLLYGLACQIAEVDLFSNFVHGGLAGSFGYALLTLYAFTLMSIGNDTKMKLVLALPLSALGILACFYLTPFKESVNISYVLISFVISYDVYAIIKLFDHIQIKKYDFLTTLGKNSLTTYCLHFLMTFTYGICLNALCAYVPAGVVIQCILFAIGMTMYPIIMSIIVRAMAKKGWVIKL